ncbi:tryptophanyl-tRNA synthetase [Sodiomyces alkalinus F11]|uniref:Tryptophan--tRNA ligase, mitochondrial n=1 Tax=Sodiomyces alkalinus (strain CBS 110278 / VKM F-3762 / F11) TaxID=1314773 RepID=A0A3N2PWG1_SODAK|nr:tryptophanyl-tRNA synthetase [Sodiomyces alkalinus F11]ROT38869.1 tryptophanyl-tRNA synthetase [Sodiomyces alkalinus F11]
MYSLRRTTIRVLSPGGRCTISTAPRVIFSGIQPTGTPHLGNFAGAIRQWLNLQHDPDEKCRRFFSVVDLHAITSPQHGQQLRQRKRETLAALLATGLDPSKSALFYQSSVPAHTELMWILSCIASTGYLSRMTQWKSKLGLSPDTTLQDGGVKASLKLGLFSYPVLQAADILVHRATHVPVGDDQRQHLEFARECVTNFNHAYGPHLRSPQTITSSSRRIMSLQQPTKKMSKSDVDSKSHILITDTPEEIRRKVMAALTDSVNSVSYDPEARPGVSNLLDILSIFDSSGRDPAQLAEDLLNRSLMDLKQLVADAVITGLQGIRERFIDFLSADEGRYIDWVEAEGARKARENAEETMAIVRQAIGL